MYRLLLLLLFSFNLSFAQQGTIIKNGDAVIYYKTFGSGKPLLLINGGPGMNSEGFDGIAEKLSASNLVITYDQRGTGRSILKKIDNTSITMNLMVEDVEAIRKHLKIEKWIIMGHSFGGMLAAFYATIHPGNISSMILSSSGGIDLGLLTYVSNNINSKLSKQELDSLEYWNNRMAAGDTDHVTRLGRGRALAPAYVTNKKFIPVIAERLTQGNAVINGLIWNDMRSIHFDCSEILSTFKQPVLILQGKDDIIEEKTAIKAHKVLQRSTLVFIDHSGHYGWLDNETDYLAAIQKFLKEHNQI
ncbi:MAG: alpha/beta fold hydrolase [Ferruginibacter sp.]